MRERAARGEFSYRMETDDEFNARPNTQGGRKTYFYAPKGVEVPSMSHGETLSVYLEESKADAIIDSLVERTEAEAAEKAEAVVAALETAEPHPATTIEKLVSDRTHTTRSTVGHMIAVTQALVADADPDDTKTLMATAYYLSRAIGVLTEGAVQNG